jgi:nicotinamide phosphoribosyltransferase
LATVNGIERDVFKNPVTDHGKRSKSGRMKLVKTEDAGGSRYQTVRMDQPGEDQLVEIFREGKIMRECRFPDIRQRARTWI